MNRITVVLALFVIATGNLPGQDSQPAPATPPKTVKTAPADSIFSGTVTELSSDSLSVLRSALVRESVKRTFILEPQTVVEGKLRVKARVTVRYTTDENGQFHALHIIVR